MKINNLFLISFFILTLLSIKGLDDIDADVRDVYSECGISDYITFEVFKIAYNGKQKIEELKNSDILTIIDFSKPSTNERLFIIDLKNREIVLKSLVAHGKNSGENFAKTFSNTSRSLKSCLGFYKTAETYYGKHGYSLRLDGLEDGYNNNSRKRAIVIHGASYVSYEFAKKYGRIGRSWGCPALPLDTAKEIIDEIKNGSCLFIYGEDKDYLGNSSFIK